MPLSPTKRTLDAIRKQGATCQVVEHWNAFAKRRIDLFGIIDIVAIIGSDIYGIQATSGDNHSHRREKAIAEPKLKLWLEAGGKFLIVSWRKSKPRGHREQWTMRQEAIGILDLCP